MLILPLPVAINEPLVVVVGAVHESVAVAVVREPAVGVVAVNAVGAEGRESDVVSVFMVPAYPYVPEE